MTRTEYLTRLLEALRQPEHGDDLTVEFRPFKGWFLVGDARHFGDEGDWLGDNWREAETGLRWFLGQ